MATIVDRLDDLAGLVGRPLGPSSWVDVVARAVDVVIERDGGGKPVCVAQPIFRFYR